MTTKTIARTPLWDNAKGLLILLVVLGHYIQWNLAESYIYTVIYNTVYTFHMPAFAFITGFFAPKNPNHRRIMGFMMVLVVFQLLSHAWASYSGFMPLLPYIYKYPMWTLWYILSLIYWYLIIWYVPIKKIYLFFLSIPLYIAAAWIINDGFFLSILRTLYFLPFVLLGNILKEEKNALIPINKPIALALFISGVGVLMSWPELVSPNWNAGVYTFYQLGATMQTSIAVTLYYYVLAAFLGYMLIASMPNKPIPILTRVGEHSLSVFLWHGLIVLITTYYNITTLLWIDTATGLIVWTVGTALLCTAPVLTIPVNAIIGSRKPSARTQDA